MYTLVLVFYLIYFLLFFLKIQPKIYYKIIAFTIWTPLLWYDPILQYYKSGQYLDILRFITEWEMFRRYGWDGFSGYDGLILSKAYVYFGSLFDSDVFLPIINVILCYFIVGFTIHQLSRKWGISYTAERGIILYTALLQDYMRIVTNIRMPLAAEIFFLLLVYELCLKRHQMLCRLGYAVLMLLHPGVAMWIVVRLLAAISFKYVIPSLLIVFAFFEWGFTKLIIFLAALKLDFITYALMKMSDYSEGGSIDMIFNTSFRISWCSIDVAVMILCIIILAAVKKYIANENKIIIRFGMYVSLIGFIGTAIANQFIITRFEIVELSLISIYVVMCCNCTVFAKEYSRVAFYAKGVLIIMFMLHGVDTVYHSLLSLG